MAPLETGKPLTVFGKKMPAPAALADLWHGQVHMHTAFWVAWVVPLAVFAMVSSNLPAFVDVVLLPYLLLASVGAWRATGNPPGSMWAPTIYRVLLAIFAISVILTAGLQVHDLINQA